MSHPFPGMNPWLERPALWRDVHTSLISAIRDYLSPRLEPRYFVGVETHTYISTAPTQPVVLRYPDVNIIKTSQQPMAAGVAMLDVATPVEVQLPRSESYEEPYLEVRLTPGGEVVTVIELLSHSNKRAGKDREDYIDKRESYITSEVNIVEIDLLRAEEPMPYTNRPGFDYRIFVRRMPRKFRAALYDFTLRQPIPIFPIPLLPDDQEPLLDLGTLLHELYDRARYKLVLDYSKPPVPPLDEETATWAQTCLANGGITIPQP